MIQNRFEKNQFFLGSFYSVLLKGCSVSSMNCGKVSCGPFLFSHLKMEEDRRFIGVVLISLQPVEVAGGFCEELELNRYVFSTFAVNHSIEDCVSLF